MAKDRITIWKFDSAPAQLRSLHQGAEPQWLVLIPDSLWPEIEHHVQADCAGWLINYRAPNGYVVLVGTNSVARSLLAAGELNYKEV